MAKTVKGKRGAQKKPVATKKKETSTTQQGKEKNSSFALRVEIQGIIIMLITGLAMAAILGMDMGTFGEIVGGIFSYGFGLLGIIPALGIFYIGWMLLYVGKRPRMGRRTLLWAIFYILIITLIPLFRVDEGKEMMTTNLANQGGVVGGLIASLLRNFVGSIGAIIVDIVLLIVDVILITRMSLRVGLHKAKDTAAVGVVVASKQAAVIRERVQEKVHTWQEERKKAYDHEKDPLYGKSSVEIPVIVTEPAEEAVEAPAVEAVVAEGIASATVDEVNTSAAVDHGEIANTMTADDTQEASTDDIHDVSRDEEGSTGEETVVQVEVNSSHVNSPVSSTRQETNCDLALEGTRGAVSALLGGIPVAPTLTMPVMPFAMGGEEVEKVEVAKPTEPVASAEPVEPVHITEGIDLTDVPSITTEADREAVAVTTGQTRIEPKIYHYPSLEMLSKGQSNPVAREEVAHNAALLEGTLKNFGITAKVVNATQGPTVTRYELEPAPGTKVSKILNLQDDLKMSLAAIDIRIEAPIPGKSAVGIEIPNKNVSAVHLRDVLDCDDFLKAKGGIPVGLGKDIADMPVITDLAKMPHLLVAGSTGSGKSVCVNTLISSILFSRTPEEVKLILIDPKMVELSVYNGIPHLMVPVITDMNKAASALRWAVREMDERYKTLAAEGVRNIKSYNETHPDTAMPLVLIIIDELADLMMTNPDVEESIDRLAAKARAAGIHMVLATQRPSVDVITGKIKANVPSRISFAVATQIDSRTILDQSGAERLLGKGDMLFNPIGANKPIRLQGAFISDEEVEEVVDFVKKQGQVTYDAAIEAELESGSTKGDDYSTGDDTQDELLERAIQLVLEHKQASASMLQRRLRVGFSRAGRLIDAMAEMRIIGPATNSSKGRDILMGVDQIRELYFPDFEIDV